MSAFFKVRQKKTAPFLSMVIAAAGRSSRMGTDKLAETLAGVPVLARTLLALECCDTVSEIILVTRAESLSEVGGLCEEYGIRKAAKVLPGGDSRLLSVLTGVRQASRAAALIGVHDGARPLVTPDLVRRTAEAAARFGAAVPAVPVTDTLRYAKNGVGSGTPDREGLFAVQTPQIFEASLLKAALERAFRENRTVTDDAQAVEALGVPIRLTEGAYENIKLTTPPDLLLAEAILRKRGEAGCGSAMDMMSTS